MKTKKVFKTFILASMILGLIPSYAKGELKDIKEIRGEENYFADVILNTDYMDFYRKNPKAGNRLTDVVNNENYDPSAYTSDNILDDLANKKFAFGGVHNWITEVYFKEDGEFYGSYIAGMGPNMSGICEFEGKFSVDSKVNDTCYILKLDNFEVTSPTGETVVDEGAGFDGGDTITEYTDYPYGFSVSNEDTENIEIQDKYTLYLPHRKRSEMSDKVNEYLDWARPKEVDDYESMIYLLVNNSTIDVFCEWSY